MEDIYKSFNQSKDRLDNKKLIMRAVYNTWI